MTRKKKMGRPTIAKSKKDYQISLKLDREAGSKLQSLSDINKISRSELIRQFILQNFDTEADNIIFSLFIESKNRTISDIEIRKFIEAKPVPKSLLIAHLEKYYHYSTQFFDFKIPGIKVTAKDVLEFVDRLERILKNP